MAELRPYHRTALPTFETVARYAVTAGFEPGVRLDQYPCSHGQQRQDPVGILVLERHHHGLIVVMAKAFGHDKLGPVQIRVLAVGQAVEPVNTQFTEF